MLSKALMMSQVLDALIWRYATKKFDPTRELSEEQVHRIAEAFNLTATSYGLQPVRLLIIQDKKLREQLVPVSMGQRQVADASHLLVFCIERTIDKDFVDTYFDQVEDVRQTPSKILQPYREHLIERFTTDTSEATQVWATKQAYLAMGNLLTVCAMEQIDACPMEGFEPEAYDTILSLSEKGLQSVLAMPIGYRAQDDIFATMKKVRKPLQDMVTRL